MTPDPATELERAVDVLSHFVIATSALAERRHEPRARHRLDTAVVAARAALLRLLDEPEVAARFARMPARQG